MPSKKLSPEKLLDIAMSVLDESDGDATGICLICGSTQSGVEPDATNYQCESCDEKEVFGAQEVILMFAP